MRVNNMFLHVLTQWAKSSKNSLKEYTQNTVPCCQKDIPTDCFFGDFAHWYMFLSIFVLEGFRDFIQRMY